MAFVVVPSKESTPEIARNELVRGATPLPFRMASDRMQVSPNTVYLVRANSATTIENGMLRVRQDKKAPEHSMPIDIFLRSLAKDQNNRAIGVVLSGAASHGALGLEALKAEGGITFSQDSKSAKHEGTPNVGSAADGVDFTLPLEDIARELIILARHPYFGEGGEESRARGKRFEAQLDQILGLLRKSCGVAFSEHHWAVIERKIQRRMMLNKCDKLDDYALYLDEQSDEIEALHQDLLLKAAGFFRDPEAFDALKKVVYPAILKNRSPADAIRIWVPGCFAGEEAYSHAIALLEYLEESGAGFPLQIFGTDLSEKAIQRARSGVFDAGIRADVSERRLQRFFTATKEGYRINKNIRDMCVFATQNLGSDPPFSRIDLVSCRNVLVDMSPSLQREVIPLLHHALKSKGFLMAGKADEVLVEGMGLFERADRKHAIYRRKELPQLELLRFHANQYRLRPRAVDGAVVLPNDPPPPETRRELRKEVDLLLAKYAPAAVVVSEDLEIIETRGHTGRYLELSSGPTSLKLLKMARPDLRFAIQETIRKARERQLAVKKENIQVDQGGYYSLVDIEVVPFQPLQRNNSNQKLLVVFKDSLAPLVLAKKKGIASERHPKERRLIALQQELAATKEHLQATIEAQVASNEELQAANQEIQARNEELQLGNEELHSVNEELRTTNEELQASRAELEIINQELSAVNERVRHRDLQLIEAKNEVVNIPIVMLGRDLRLRRYTPAAELALGLTARDVGQPVRHLQAMLKLPGLETLLRGVMRNEKQVQQEIEDSEGRWYRLRVMPYRTADGAVDGAVLTMMDISDLKRSLRDLATGQDKLKETLHLMQNGLLVVDGPSSRLQMANDRLWEILGESVLDENSVLNFAGHTVNVHGSPSDSKEWAITRSMGGEVVTAEEVEWVRSDGQHLLLAVNSAPIRDKSGKVVSVVATFTDMTYRRSAEQMLRVSEQMAATGRLAAALAHEINNPLEALTNLNYLLAQGETLDSESRKYVDLARVELNRISHISSSLLGLYRAESKAESFLIRAVINDVLDVFSSKIAVGKVRVVKRYEVDGTMHGSYTEVRQVFLNLIGNALEAMDHDGELTIRTSASRDWRNLGVRGFRISVTDNGPGIPSELLPKVFEAFFTTKGAKGTGLGLWISNGIVHRYGGNIRVRTRTDSGKSGTTFSVFFPNATVKRSVRLKSKSQGECAQPSA